AGQAHSQEDSIEQRRERKRPAHVKRDVNKVRGDPKPPVLKSLPAQEVLGGQAENRGERIPKWRGAVRDEQNLPQPPGADRNRDCQRQPLDPGGAADSERRPIFAAEKPVQIGRASCRERGVAWGGGR